MHKKTNFTAILTAWVLTAFVTVYAQGTGMLPGLSAKDAQRPSSTARCPRVLPHGLPPVQTLVPLDAKKFPYNKRPLRDPFWTVGYFPPQWGVELKPEQQKEMSDSEWKIPTSQLEVSGVSRMGSRVLAIVNNELKKVGDVVEISYLGKIYQWKIGDIQADGDVRFDRHQIINDASMNRSTP